MEASSIVRTTSRVLFPKVEVGSVRRQAEAYNQAPKRSRIVPTEFLAGDAVPELTGIADSPGRLYVFIARRPCLVVLLTFLVSMASAGALVGSGQVDISLDETLFQDTSHPYVQRFNLWNALMRALPAHTSRGSSLTLACTYGQKHSAADERRRPRSYYPPLASAAMRPS